MKTRQKRTRSRIETAKIVKVQTLEFNKNYFYSQESDHDYLMSNETGNHQVLRF